MGKRKKFGEGFGEKSEIFWPTAF